MDTFLSVQPETYRQLLKRSLLLYRKIFSQVFLLALLIAMICFIPQLVSIIFVQDVFTNLSPSSPHWLWMIVINLVSLMLFIAILWHTYCVSRAFHEPLIEDFYVGVKKVILVLIAAFIQSALFFVMLLTIYGLHVLLKEFHLYFSDYLIGMIFTAFILIGQFLAVIYILILFIFYLPLIAIENKTILISLTRSVSLVYKNWWRTFWVQATPWFCYLILSVLIKVSLANLFFPSLTSLNLWASLLRMLLFAFFIPWIATIMVVQLRDLELRKKSSS